jgi:hypothetical protein
LEELIKPGNNINPALSLQDIARLLFSQIKSNRFTLAQTNKIICCRAAAQASYEHPNPVPTNFFPKQID